jgi:hypothetical protein
MEGLRADTGISQMPYNISWYIENAVIYTEFSGEISEVELYEVLKEIEAMARASGRPIIHSISDVSRVTKSLPLPTTVSVTRKIDLSFMSGWSIVVGEKDALIKFVSSIARQLMKLRQRNFDTLSDAIAFLRANDSSIDWDLAEKSG